MKEYILQLVEELVGAHSYGIKRAKADEIGALVKTAVFPADEPDSTETVPSSSDMAAQQKLPGDPHAANSLILSGDNHE